MVILTPATDEMSPDVKKNKVLNTHFEKEHRLVEYFVIVSSVPRNHKKDEDDQEEKNVSVTSSPRHRGWSSADIGTEDEEDDDEFIDDYDFQPVITARYPLEDHEGNPLHESVTFFCHPSGGIRLRTECSMPKVHYFAATGGHGKQMYGTCLTLWEPYIITSTRSSPKKVAMDGTVEESEKSEKKKEVYLPKCLVLLSTYPYLMAFREYLTQLNRLSKMGEMMLPLERYIANFCAEIPAPPPGSFEVQTTILDSVIKLWSPPHNQPIAWIALPFSHLFQCLDLDNIVTVWQCLAVERQVLLTSTQLSLLTTCAEILLSMLFPMRWSHAYIPVLPHFLIPILSAPMPFLCGINKANLADALCDLSRECVVVDLDKNLVTMGPSTEPLPPFPKSLDHALRQKLEDNAGMVFREARSLTKKDDFSDRGAHLPPHVKLMADGMWESQLCLFDEAFHLAFTPEESRKNLLNGNDTSGIYGDESSEVPIRIMTAAEKQNLRKQSQWDAVQEAFLDTYVGLLRNYRKFLVFPSKDNEGAYGGAGFRSKEFIQAQRYDMQEFLQQLCGSQMFDDFITKRLYGSGEADVTFFDLAIDRFLKDSRIGKLIKSATNDTSSVGPLLQSARVHRKLKTIVPPEPSSDDLPPPPPPTPEGAEAGGPLVTTLTDDNLTSADDQSVASASSQGTHSTRGTTRSTARSLAADSMSTPKNAKHKAYRSIQDKAEEILEKHRGYRYTYPTFPSKFNADLFGTPRPMPTSVIAEFDRQRQDAAQFRRKKSRKKKQDKTQQLHRVKSSMDPDVPPSAEVATFTLFFMAFSAMVGKELLEISDNPLIAKPERVILSNYVPPSAANSDDESSVIPPAPSLGDGDESFEDALDEIEKAAAAEMKSVRPNLDEFEDAASEEDELESEDNNGEETCEVEDDVEDKNESEEAEAVEKEPEDTADVNNEAEEPVENVEEAANENGGEDDGEKLNGDTTSKPEKELKKSEPRMRFTASLSASQIEEAKATGRAQLGLAFELLTMMKKRGLKADPEAYQCLIDACGRVGDTKRATELLAKMHEDGIVADGVVYSCLVSAFSAESAWKQASGAQTEDLPAWANGSSIEMDWNKLQKHSFRDNLRKQINALRGMDEDDVEENGDAEGGSTYQRFRSFVARKKDGKRDKPKLTIEPGMEFFVTEPVEMQIELGENLLEIVYPDISVDTDNETCPRCNFLLSDDDVVAGWTPGDTQDYMTSCPNCMQRFVPHFCVQSTSATFMGSRGPASALFCERLSPWVLQKEIRSVMSDREGIENLLSADWREQEIKNSVLWWNLVLSCMRYRFPFTFLLQGSFDQNLISPMPEDDA